MGEPPPVSLLSWSRGGLVIGATPSSYHCCEVMHVQTYSLPPIWFGAALQPNSQWNLGSRNCVKANLSSPAAAP